MAKRVKKASKKASKKAAKKSIEKTAKKAVKKAAPKKASKPVKPTGKKFLIIYHAPMDAMAQTMNASPEEMEAGMAMWKAWAKRVGKKLTDLGAPLVNGKRILPNGASGPSMRDVTGYSLLQAEDWDDVMDLLSGHPHISGWSPDATIEIHETMLIPGM
ncbi:MAG TPA: hypothetical protein VMI12_09460 [Puia sp.]|nr:hypothetical protein [Puia sp.]